MDVKQAVQTAKEQIAQLFADEPIQDQCPVIGPSARFVSELANAFARNPRLPKFLNWRPCRWAPSPRGTYSPGTLSSRVLDFVERRGGTP